MKPVVPRFYAVLVVLTLLGLIVWSGADWYQLRQRAEDQGRRVLRQAAGLVADRSLRPQGAETPALNQLFARVPGADPRWKVLVLWSGEGATEYYRGPRPAVPAERQVPRWEPRALSEVRVTIPVFRADGPPLTLEGIYEFYGRAEVFGLLKSCGLTLFLLLVLTTLLVVAAARDRSGTGASETQPQEPEEEGPAFEEGPLAGFDAPADTGLSDLPPLGNSEAEEEYWFEDDLTMEDLPPLEEPVPEPVAAPAVSAGAGPGAQGPSLFSPETGLGWETFLGPRLAFELERSTSQNQDLALILLAIKEGAVDRTAWGSAVREAFSSYDLDFEYQEGAAILLPGRSLDQALAAARAFVESADRSFSGVVVHAGAAARSGRLVSSETLMAEAESARRRSLAGTVRVLGLKTDPERYREHLASLSA